MPHLTPISNSGTPALLALRRTLWQLVFVGSVAATMLVRIMPDSGAFASWCVLVPLSALAVHFRQALLDLLQSHRDAPSIAARRRKPPQARRARSGNPANTRRQSRSQPPRIPSQVRPLAR